MRKFLVLNDFVGKEKEVKKGEVLTTIKEYGYELYSEDEKFICVIDCDNYKINCKEIISMTKEQTKIINSAIKSLKEFGYPNVNKKNIFTDAIYSRFFKNMLENTKEDYDEDLCKTIDELIKLITPNDIK